MTRLLYQFLVLLHPLGFREQFGDQMVCIFDESAGRKTLPLLGDGLVSLIRQWLLRSSMWKFATGAVFSGLQMVCLGCSLGVAIGEVRSYWLESAILGGPRIVCVYTPPEYDPHAEGGYRLLVLSDGLSYRNWSAAARMLDHLIRSHRLPPIISVWVDEPADGRTAHPEHNSASADFLAEEMLPWLHERWNVTRDPQKTIIGSTSEGAAAVFAALRRPDLFGNVLSQSDSFWDWHDDAQWELLTSQYEVDPRLSVRFFIMAVAPEEAAADGAALLAADQRFPDILKSRGYRVTHEEGGGTRERVHWQETLPQGLIALVR
jgi:enterochelin esterase family protein